MPGIYMRYTTPAPANPDPRLEAYARLAGVWVPDGAGDVEDWTEMVYRDLIGHRAGFTPGTEDDVDGSTPCFGPLGVWSRLQWTTAHRAADSYIHSPTFSAHCGRDIHLIDGNEAQFIAVRDAIFADPKVESIRLKDAWHAKSYHERLTRDEPDVRNEWMWVHREGDSDAFMVYGEVPMAYEYRLWVIGDEVIVGAGCVEQHTPLDSRHERFDPQVKAIRSNGRVESRPGTVAEYVRFARSVAPAFAAEGLHTYILDVAMSDGRPIIIELNHVHNAGLYALDWRVLGDAIASNPQALALDVNAGFTPWSEQNR